MVILFNFSEDLKPVQKKDNATKKISLDTGQVQDKHKTTTKTTSETATETKTSINYINKTNILNDKNVANLEKHTKKFEEINNSSDKIVTSSEVEIQEKEKSSAKKENEEMFQPTIEEIKLYFQSQDFPEQEAQKFLTYFKSVG